jgi:hypothetical protein
VGTAAIASTGTSPAAHTYTRAASINYLKPASYFVESRDRDEVSVNVYGDTAVAFTSQGEKSRYDNRDTSGHSHFTNVWLNRDGRWQVVARMAPASTANIDLYRWTDVRARASRS